MRAKRVIVSNATDPHAGKSIVVVGLKRSAVSSMIAQLSR